MKKTLGYRLRKIGSQLLALPAMLVPTKLLEHTVARVVVQRARQLPADRALRFMFAVDTLLYDEQGHQAVRYGDGVHTKHRHMKYHDYFVDRITNDQQVLDIGCGIGALAYDVAERSGATVVGVDYSQPNLDQARRQFAHKRVEYRLGDVLQEQLDQPADVIILSNVLEHLPNRPDFLRNVAEHTGASRILIRVPTFERDWRVPLKRELGVEWRLDEDHETEYTPDQFRHEMAAAGFAVVDMQVRWGEIWAEVQREQAVAHAA